MLFQMLLNRIVYSIKFIILVLIVLAAIPFGAFMFLDKLFPFFTQNFDFLFWTEFSILSIIGFVLLWKPILWIIGTLQIFRLGAE